MMRTGDYRRIEGNSRASSKNKDYPQKITLAVVFVATMIVNFLATTGKIGARVDSLSDKYRTLITPPGYTFTIWSVIYILWTIFVVLQLLPNRFLSQSELFYSLSAKGKS